MNGKWVMSSRIVGVNSKDDYSEQGNLKNADGSESPDFFYDNQFVEQRADDGKWSKTFCLGKNIYSVSHNGESYEVVKRAPGYVQEGRLPYQIFKLFSDGAAFPI